MCYSRLSSIGVPNFILIGQVVLTLKSNIHPKTLAFIILEGLVVNSKITIKNGNGCKKFVNCKYSNFFLFLTELTYLSIYNNYRFKYDLSMFKKIRRY